MILPLECKGRGPHLADMWQLGPWCNGNTTETFLTCNKLFMFQRYIIGVRCDGRTQYFGYWRIAGSNPVTPTIKTRNMKYDWSKERVENAIK